jgi:voltage-gated potassium channel
MLREKHGATLLAVTRDGNTFSNPATDFMFELNDDLIVVAESLGALSPLQNSTAFHDAETEVSIDLKEVSLAD